jgi:CRISPR-associated protein Cmr1
MQSITFTCEVITPMFLHGADGQTPELRAPSIKGALRFWWRAIHGNLSIDELRRREAEIFGGTKPNENQGRSKLLIRLTQSRLTIKNHKPLPHKKFEARAFDPGGKFTITLSLSSIVHGFTLDKARSLFIVMCALGGLGKRVRRGMGSVNIVDIDGQTLDCVSLQDILHHLETVNQGYFHLNEQGILSRFNSPATYPWIKQIQVGDKNDSNYLLKICNTTHDFRQKNGYPESLGYAKPQERFASPVYVSLISVNGDLRPVITTLKAVPPTGQANSSLQDQFKQAILL